MKKIIQLIQKVAPLQEQDTQRLTELLRSKTLSKGDYWIQAGIRNRQIAFVEEGYLRKFYIKDGKEITDFFYFENDFSADLPSIIGNSAPLASAIAMQKTRLATFSYDDFTECCKQSPALEHVFRVLVEQAFLRFYQRSVSFIMQSPAERYYDLIGSSPRIFQQAAQHHIASYLGISAQHLSRLRGQHAIS